MNNLIELAARCEAADRPDRELDLDIREALGFEVRRTPDYIFRATRACGMYLDRRENEPDRWVEAPKVTASLDAAMQLVPEGRKWSLGPGFGAPFKVGKVHFENLQKTDGEYEGEWFWAAKVFGEDGRAKTPALALCAASLRARAALKGGI